MYVFSQKHQGFEKTKIKIATLPNLFQFQFQQHCTVYVTLVSKDFWKMVKFWSWCLWKSFYKWKGCPFWLGQKLGWFTIRVSYKILLKGNCRFFLLKKNLGLANLSYFIEGIKILKSVLNRLNIDILIIYFHFQFYFTQKIDTRNNFSTLLNNTSFRKINFQLNFAVLTTVHGKINFSSYFLEANCLSKFFMCFKECDSLNYSHQFLQLCWRYQID